MKSEGICFYEKCSRCLTDAEFSFYAGRQSLFGKKMIKRITCSSCKTIFQNEDPVEGDKLFQIAEITEEIKSSSISVEEGLKRIVAVGSEIFKEIQEGSKTWSCDNCGEENFLSVGECWSCQTEHPALADMKVDEED